jgi:hypothetical protein
LITWTYTGRDAPSLIPQTQQVKHAAARVALLFSRGIPPECDILILKYDRPADQIPKEQIDLMSESAPAHPTAPFRTLWKSFLALAAGVVAVVILSLGTDAVLRVAGLLPSLGESMNNSRFVLVTFYRLIYAVFGSYITARLAPYAPMGHALVGGVLGVVLNVVGAVVTWNHVPSMGPHWYPIALILASMPCAWLGGKLRLMQMVSRS